MIRKFYLIFVIFLYAGNSFSNQLPDLGSEYRSEMSVQEEELIGDHYMRQIRASDMVYEDPVISEYINYLGQQLTPYVETPYSNKRIKFFVVKDNSINAFAFFGGHVAVNSGLMLLTQNESELAGVMAHELSHISQQHILRQISDNKRLIPITIAGSIAAALCGVPDLIIPVLANHQQKMLNFSRQHEQEADRLGMQVLSKAKFDPNGLPNILEKMSGLAKFDQKPPEYLTTHPLYDSRISDVKNRAANLPIKKHIDSKMFYLIQHRISVSTNNNLNKLISTYKTKLQNYPNDLYIQYGYAYTLLKKGQLTKAEQLMQNLIKQDPENIVLQLSMSEIELAQNQYQKAQKRIENTLALYPDSAALLMQYCEILLLNKNPLQAKKVLAKYTRHHEPTPMYYEFVRQTEGMLKNKTAIYEANAEWYVLHGAFSEAIVQLDLALAQNNSSKKNSNKISKRKAELLKLMQDLKSV